VILDHFHGCIGKVPAGHSITSRHHRIAGEVVAHAARQGGCTVVREPLFDSVVVTTTAVDPETRAEFEQEKVTHDGERGDLLLIRGDERLLIDVTVVRPMAPTYLRHAGLAVTHRGLALAAAAERAKHAKYDALCKERGWRMIPFAVESTGAVGASARRLLHTLASRVDDMSGQAFIQQSFARLSVALQNANAAITIGGLQRLRLNQLSISGDFLMNPSLGGYPSRRRAQQHLTRVRDTRVDMSAAFHGSFRMASVTAA
jgi:hypothetical protein